MASASPLSLELYLDHTCPWSFMAFTATREVARQKRLRPRWRLLPIAGSDGVTRADTEMHLQRFAAEWPLIVSTARRDFGLTLRKPASAANGRPAAEAVCWLRRQAPGPELEPDLHAALFEARFALGEDIDDPELLRRIAGGLMGRPILRDALPGSGQAEALAEERRAAGSAGVTAVPTLVLAGSHLMLGAEPASVLAQAIEQLDLVTQLGPIGEIG